MNSVFYTRLFVFTLGILTVVQARADGGAEVAAALDAFHRAAAEADFKTYSALMSKEMVFLGTDGTERWQGQEFKDFAEPYFNSGQGWTYRASDRHVSVAVDGRIAWFDEALENTQLGQCRGSGVLVMHASGWKIAQYNLSIPIPNAMAKDLAKSIAIHKKTSAETLE